jgi:hypothetical protein
MDSKLSHQNQKMVAAACYFINDTACECLAVTVLKWYQLDY